MLQTQVFLLVSARGEAVSAVRRGRRVPRPPGQPSGIAARRSPACCIPWILPILTSSQPFHAPLLPGPLFLIHLFAINEK